MDKTDSKKKTERVTKGKNLLTIILLTLLAVFRWTPSQLLRDQTPPETAQILQRAGKHLSHSLANCARVFSMTVSESRCWPGLASTPTPLRKSPTRLSLKATKRKSSKIASLPKCEIIVAYRILYNLGSWTPRSSRSSSTWSERALRMRAREHSAIKIWRGDCVALARDTTLAYMRETHSWSEVRNLILQLIFNLHTSRCKTFPSPFP